MSDIKSNPEITNTIPTPMEVKAEAISTKGPMEVKAEAVSTKDPMEVKAEAVSTPKEEASTRKGVNGTPNQTELKVNPFEAPQEDFHWYAAKVFYNRTNTVCEKLESEGLKLYRQSLMPSYIFINCTENKILELREHLWEKMFIYYNVEKTKPYAIPEKEMASFILVTSADFSQVLFLGEDKLEYHSGDKVRVKEGPFKGAEGHIKRIKRDRKIVVSINGVAAVALAYIPPQFLEPVTD